MKRFILVVGLLLVSAVADEDISELSIVSPCGGEMLLDDPSAAVLRYHDFLKKFNRPTHSMECSKFQTFLENERIVKQLNANPEDHAVYSVHSPFGDMKVEEFMESLLMPRRKVTEKHQAKFDDRKYDKEPSSNHDSFDWTEHGAVSDVRNQGSLGTCYDFAAAGCVEGQLAIHHAKKNPIVSVEQSLECDNQDEPETGEAVCGEFGGWPHLVFEYWKKIGGFVTEKDWPYCAGTLDKHDNPGCFPCMVKNYDRSSCGEHDDFYCNATTTLGQGEKGLCKDTEWIAAHRLGTVTGYKKLSQNETLLAQQIADYGPAAAILDAGTLQFYSKGIVGPKRCSPEVRSHAVLIVGFGEDNGQKFFKVKNSWGPSWGEDGFFRIERGSEACGINRVVTGAIIA